MIEMQSISKNGYKNDQFTIIIDFNIPCLREGILNFSIHNKWLICQYSNLSCDYINFQFTIKIENLYSPLRGLHKFSMLNI